MSPNDIMRLEQGRDRRPSPSVLDAPELDDAATAHLQRLGTPANERSRPARRRGADNGCAAAADGADFVLHVAAPPLTMRTT